MSADVLASPAVALIVQLEDHGFTLTAAGDCLRVCPSSRLTPDLRAQIDQHRNDLLMLLRVCDEGVALRQDVFRRQLEKSSAPTVPAFLLVSNVPYVAGRCFSCGDGLPEAQYGRCWRCSLAWRLACRLPVPADLAAALDAAKLG